MTRNYKTGPRRSRRRPDPSANRAPGQPIFILSDVGSSGGSGSAEVVVQLLFDATGTIFDAEDTILTGVESTSIFRDIGGDEFTPEITIDTFINALRFSVPSGMAAGQANCVIQPLDPAVRTKGGGWLSGRIEVLTVT